MHFVALHLWPKNLNCFTVHTYSRLPLCWLIFFQLVLKQYGWGHGTLWWRMVSLVVVTKTHLSFGKSITLDGRPGINSTGVSINRERCEPLDQIYLVPLFFLPQFGNSWQPAVLCVISRCRATAERSRESVVRMNSERQYESALRTRCVGNLLRRS